MLKLLRNFLAVTAGVVILASLASAEIIRVELEVDEPSRLAEVEVLQNSGPVGAFIDGPVRGGTEDVVLGSFTITPEYESVALSSLYFSCYGETSAVRSFRLVALEDGENAEQVLDAREGTSHDTPPATGTVFQVDDFVITEAGRQFEVRTDLEEGQFRDHSMACGIPTPYQSIELEGMETGDTIPSGRHLRGNFGYTNYPLEVTRSLIRTVDVQTMFYPDVVEVPSDETQNFTFLMNAEPDSIMGFGVIFNYANYEATVRGSTGRFYWYRDWAGNQYFRKKAGWGGRHIDLIDAELKPLILNDEEQETTWLMNFEIDFEESYPLMDYNSISYYIRYIDPVTGRIKTSPAWTRYEGNGLIVVNDEDDEPTPFDDGYFTTVPAEELEPELLVRRSDDLDDNEPMAPGSTDNELMSFIVENPSGQDIRWDELRIQGVRNLADNNEGQNISSYSKLQNCRLTSGDAVVSDVEDFYDSNRNFPPSIEFQGNDNVIPAEDFVEYTLVCDFASNLGAGRLFQVELTDIDSEDENGDYVEDVFNDGNGELLSQSNPIRSHVFRTFGEPVSLVVKRTPGSSQDQILVRNGEEQEIGIFRFTAAQDLMVEELRLRFSDLLLPNFSEVRMYNASTNQLIGSGAFEPSDPVEGVTFLNFNNVDTQIEAGESLDFTFTYIGVDQSEEAVRTHNSSFRIEPGMEVTSMATGVTLEEDEIELESPYSNINMVRFSKPVFAVNVMNTQLSYSTDAKLYDFSVGTIGSRAVELYRFRFGVDYRDVEIVSPRLFKVVGDLETEIAAGVFDGDEFIFDLNTPEVVEEDEEARYVLRANLADLGQGDDDFVGVSLGVQDVGRIPWDQRLQDWRELDVSLIWSDQALDGDDEENDDYYNGYLLDSPGSITLTP